MMMLTDHNQVTTHFQRLPILQLYIESDNLYTALTNLVKSFKRLGDSMLSVPKSGRTHLMDAMPVTLGMNLLHTVQQ